MLWKLYNNMLNLFINPEWDIDKKRKYRQTTGIIYFSNLLAVISLFLSIYYELLYPIFLQIANINFCLSEYKLLKNKKLKLAQTVGIYYFETQVFATAVLFSTHFSDNLISTYPIILAVIYPSVAALFDLNILKHFLIGVFQIVFLQILFKLVPGIFFLYIDLLEENNQFLIKFISFSYLLVFNTIIVYLFYEEQIRATKKLNEYSDSLNRKNRKIEKLNKTKDRLLSIISHDLRSPFNSIIGFSYLLLESKGLSKKQQKYSEIIQECSNSTLNLLDNLLYWSKSQMNSIEPNFKRHNLNKIINEVLENLQIVALQKGIKLNNNIDKDVHVLVDINLIEIVFRNLISNAIKFSNKNSSIDVSSNKLSDEFLKISIKDYGIGMDKNTLKTIFNENTSRLGTNKEKGSGLGLLLCQEFVTIHNGKIWFESEKEKGTEVQFTVPFA